MTIGPGDNELIGLREGPRAPLINRNRGNCISVALPADALTEGSRRDLYAARFLFTGVCCSFVLRAPDDRIGGCLRVICILMGTRANIAADKRYV